jgi:hypothetical protein
MAVIKLTTDQQSQLVGQAPAMFVPLSGGDGRLGSTNVRLEAMDERTLKDPLAAAWSNVAPKPAVKRRGTPPP